MNLKQLLNDAGYNRHTCNFPDTIGIARELYDADVTGDEIVQHLQNTVPLLEKVTVRETGVDFTMFGEDLILPNAREQMESVMKLPHTVGGALMPDAHQGYGLPIGGVYVSRDVIHPYFVGVDIGCSVFMSAIGSGNLRELVNLDTVDWIHREMINHTYFGRELPVEPFDHDIFYDDRWDDIEAIPALAGVRDHARRQIGSSGGGNHFVDLVQGKCIHGLQIPKLDAEFIQGDEFYGLLSHSGSRGAGYKIANWFSRQAVAYTSSVAHDIPKEHAWLSLYSELGQLYVSAMQLMGDYAIANHHTIHASIARAIGDDRPFMAVASVHNLAWIDEDNVVVHRKGATPAEANRVSLIPGTSGTDSYMCTGLGNEASYMSSSHGAGRFDPRTVAKRAHNQETMERHYNEHEIMTHGVGTDETVMAYKDIDDVMAAQDTCVQPVATLTPLAVCMGERGDDLFISDSVWDNN